MNGLKFKTNKKNRNDNVAVLHTTSARTFQRSQDDVNCKDVKLRGLGLILSHWWNWKEKNSIFFEYLEASKSSNTVGHIHSSL